MKKITISLILLAVIGLLLALAMYNDSVRSYLPAALQMQMTAEKAVLEYPDAHSSLHDHSAESPKKYHYIGPMHPQIMRDEAGTCPICGMDLVKQEIELLSKIERLLKSKSKQYRYICPMHPQIIQDESGTCPICGMDLVKQEIEMSTETSDYPAVRISSATAQNMGIRTAEARRQTLWKYIKTVGNITYNDDYITHVHPRANGWIEILNIKQEGTYVEKGQTLLSFYSPDISAALAEYLATYRAARSATVIKSARNRLHLLNVTDELINQVEKQGDVEFLVPIIAPRSGIVSRLSIGEGMYIKPDMELFSIVDLSTVWVLVDVFEHQIDWVKVGNSAEVTVAALPGKTWEGQIDYIYPELSPKTRTLQVRLRFDNAEGLLKPNMFADVVIYGGPNKNAITIPREAVIRGESGARVVTMAEDGRYIPVKVTTGMSSRGVTEILSGLDVGQKVVLSGQFLLDSESNLKASIQRMQGN